MDFSSPHLRTLSAAVHLFGASSLAYCFASRFQSIHFTRWRNIPWARWCIMLVFFDSWLFHVYSGLLIQGYGLDRNTITCSMAIYLCIGIYCLSKILIYCFLIERVYVVWPHAGTRLSSKAFCLCLLMMIGYFAVALDMIIGRNTYFQDRHNCMIGLKPFASIPLLSYDLFLNVALTSMFLWPLQQAHFRDVRLRKIARRTLFAALVALTTSSINIAVLTIKHGVEMGWICLASCGLDVTINALVLYAITGYRPEESTNYLTSINFSISFNSHSAVISSRQVNPPSSTPNLALPPPVQDKGKLNRFSLGLSSQKVITNTLQRPQMAQQDSFFLRDRTTDYPHAHIETIESVQCERRGESLSPSWTHWMLPGSWKRRRELREMANRVSATPSPFEVQVTTVQQVGTVSAPEEGTSESKSNIKT